MEGRINEADIVKLEEEIDQAIEAEDFQSSTNCWMQGKNFYPRCRLRCSKIYKSVTNKEKRPWNSR